MFGKDLNGTYCYGFNPYLFDNARSKQELETKSTLLDVWCFSTKTLLFKKVEQRIT